MALCRDAKSVDLTRPRPYRTAFDAVSIGTNHDGLDYQNVGRRGQIDCRHKEHAMKTSVRQSGRGEGVMAKVAVGDAGTGVKTLSEISLNWQP